MLEFVNNAISQAKEMKTMQAIRFSLFGDGMTVYMENSKILKKTNKQKLKTKKLFFARLQDIRYIQKSFSFYIQSMKTLVTKLKTQCNYNWWKIKKKGNLDVNQKNCV